jgi:hypothetical protein
MIVMVESLGASKLGAVMNDKALLTALIWNLP